MLIGEAVPLVYQYLKANPAAPIRSKFSHILVDEFQDLNKAEQGVLRLLTDKAEVCIVGDADQSIYSFKHAHPDGIRQWCDDNAGSADLALTECRRCPTRVVDMANLLIANNQDRSPIRALNPRQENGPGRVAIFQYKTLADEILGVAGIIENLIKSGTPPGDILVLAQRSVIGTPTYEALMARTVPTRSYYADSELDDEEVQKRFALPSCLSIEKTASRSAGLSASAAMIGGQTLIRRSVRTARIQALARGKRLSNLPRKPFRFRTPGLLWRGSRLSARY